MRKTGIILLILIFLISFVSSAVASKFNKQVYPMTAKDEWGHSLKLYNAPERIISCMPSITEMLFDLGLGKNIVGVTENCDYPKEAKKIEKVGRVKMNLEKVISLKPDLIVMLGSAQLDDIKKFRKFGLPVFVIDPEDVEGIMYSYTKLGIVTGRPHAAYQINERIQRSLKWTEVQIKKAEKEPPTVFIEIIHKPLMTASKDTLVNNIIELAGGKNIAYWVKGKYPEYSMEKLIKKDPDVIIIPEQNIKNEDVIYNDSRWQKLSAVKNKRVLFIDADIISRPTERVKGAIYKIAEFMYRFGEEEEDED